MENFSFCPKCGVAVQPGDQFCTSCGFSLAQLKTPVAEPSPAPEPPPVQSTPVVKPAITSTPVTVNTTATTTPMLHKVMPFVAVLLFVALGVYSWWDNNRNKDNYTTGTETTTTNTESEEPATNNSTPFTDVSSGIQLKDFAGVWRAYESNNNEENKTELGNPDDDLFIVYKNGTLDIYPREELNKTHSADITCGDVDGNTVNCSGTSKEDNKPFLIKLELQSSKKEMTITITPDEPTELMILKLRKLDEEPK
ncbi:MAG: zinc ribbon domain-containing protein [Chitinophagaceae bacterium]|nr:zinc ribbon domain-containing protein [Chitinophagaceae bacterium]